MRAWIVFLALPVLTSCASRDSVTASVEVTTGSSDVDRQRLADAIVGELSRDIARRVQHRVPRATVESLDGLTLRSRLVTNRVIDGPTTSQVVIECTFAHDGSVDEASRIIDACTDEVRHSLDQKARNSR